jgi:hypothetical protein
MEPTRNPERFAAVASLLAVVGCLVAIVGGVVAENSAFRGSIAASGAIGLVFAAQNARVLGARGVAHPAPAVVTTVFGLLFVVAPLLYTLPGYLSTALAQFGGLVTAAFAGYTAVESLAGPTGLDAE